MNRGKIISFSGVDGSGKTTQSKLLKSYLEKKGNKVLILKVFNYFLLNKLIGFVRKKFEVTQSGPIKKNKNPILKLWFILALFDFWLNYCLKILPKKFKYNYIISDRFFYDMAVNMLYYGYLPASIFSFYLSFLPKPDVGLVLFCEPEISSKRSHEFGIDYYNNQILLYRKVFSLNHLLAINSSGTRKKVFNDILESLNV